MGGVVIARGGQRLAMLLGRSGLAGSGIAERVRSTSFALMGLMAVASLSLVALFSHSGLPVVSLGPLPGGGERPPAAAMPVDGGPASAPARGPAAPVALLPGWPAPTRVAGVRGERGPRGPQAIGGAVATRKAATGGGPAPGPGRAPVPAPAPAPAPTAAPQPPSSAPQAAPVSTPASGGSGSLGVQGGGQSGTAGSGGQRSIRGSGDAAAPAPPGRSSARRSSSSRAPSGFRPSSRSPASSRPNHSAGSHFQSRPSSRRPPTRSSAPAPAPPAPAPPAAAPPTAGGVPPSAGGGPPSHPHERRGGSRHGHGYGRGG